MEQVARVVGSEPALAARLLKISNAASFNRTGKPVTDLRTAINRIGYNMVRSAAMSFAMAQIRASNRLQGLEDYLSDLWRRSTVVAALSFVVARQCTQINPDEAMLCGLMHGIGKLYILTRAVDHPELFKDRGALDEVINDWHASIGKAILENWDFAESMSQAVGEQDDLSRTEDVPADLRDIISIAILMASEQPLTGVMGALRLGLDSEKKLAAVTLESSEEVSALAQALGG